MKIIIDRRVEEEVLRCNSCNKNIGKSMWRAFLDGIIIDDGDEEDDKYRGCCHQHLCDYRAFLESLEGNNEELRQEIISWESSLRLKAETLSSSFRKNPKKSSNEFYTEFFKVAEIDLEKFMKDKYEIEELQKLLHGIIFQLASQCPLDWEGNDE